MPRTRSWELNDDLWEKIKPSRPHLRMQKEDGLGRINSKFETAGHSSLVSA